MFHESYFVLHFSATAVQNREEKEEGDQAGVITLKLSLSISGHDRFSDITVSKNLKTLKKLLMRKHTSIAGLHTCFISFLCIYNKIDKKWRSYIKNALTFILTHSNIFPTLI